MKGGLLFSAVYLVIAFIIFLRILFIFLLQGDNLSSFLSIPFWVFFLITYLLAIFYVLSGFGIAFDFSRYSIVVQRIAMISEMLINLFIVFLIGAFIGSIYENFLYRKKKNKKA